MMEPLGVNETFLGHVKREGQKAKLQGHHILGAHQEKAVIQGGWNGTRESGTGETSKVIQSGFMTLWKNNFQAPYP